MPRFVLLRHECPPAFGKPRHWDLMLEAGAMLASWSLSELPAAAGASVAAIKLADHRLAYLEYEGPISGGRGAVRRIDAGDCQLIECTATYWQVCFEGAVLSGLARLELCEGEAWTLTLAAASSGPAP